MSLLKITKGGSASDLYIIQMGSSDQTAQDYLDYSFTFNVLPYPQSPNDIKLEEYRLVLKVTRLS